MKLTLAQAVRLMRDENGVNDERFSEAWDMVTDHAAASIIARNAHEHLIWRNPFDNLTQFPHPGKETARVPNPNPVKTPASSTLSGEQR